MGPLEDIRVIELASTAPCAFTATLLADLGADVIKIDRPSARERPAPPDPLSRGRRTIAADLKDPAGLDALLSLIDRADILLEGFRPGVCERLGIGPDVCLERNPRLIFGRITGWGQDGEWSGRPGHDITFLALSGALDADHGPEAPPAPPSTYLSSFAGGGMVHVHGVLGALHERTRSGRGQVVDTAMIDGAALLNVMIRQWRSQVGNTVTDAPFYTTYECQDGRHVAVGAIEPRFYDTLIEQLGLAGKSLPDRGDTARWPELRECFAKAFHSRTRAHWVKVFETREACVVPVLTPAEAASHPAIRDRGTLVEVGGRVHPAPVPRFSRTPSAIPISRETTVSEISEEWHIR